MKGMAGKEVVDTFVKLKKLKEQDQLVVKAWHKENRNDRKEIFVVVLRHHSQ